MFVVFWAAGLALALLSMLPGLEWMMGGAAGVGLAQLLRRPPSCLPLAS
jgi:hypothetical protein